MPVELIPMDTELLSDRLAATEKALIGLDERVDALVEEKVNGHLAGHQEALGTLQEAHNGTGERIAAIEERILQCLEKIEEQNATLIRIEAEGDALLAEIAEGGEAPPEEVSVEELSSVIEEVPVEESSEPAAGEPTLWERILGATGPRR